MNFDLYSWHTPNGQKIFIALEEKQNLKKHW